MNSSYSETNGSISRTELKRITGEFDLETVFRLQLNNENLKSFGCILECSNLEFLNVSCNQFSDLGCIGTLKMLRYVDVSCNQLSSLSGLGECPQLVDINASGNLLSCIEDVSCLQSLEHLESLQLQDRVKGTSNPFCMSAGYQDRMLEFLPNLLCLDGDRVRGVAEEYFQLCRSLETKLDDRSRCRFAGVSENNNFPAPVSQAPQFDMESNIKEKLAASEEKFQRVLSEVRDLEVQAMIALENYEKILKC